MLVIFHSLKIPSSLSPASFLPPSLERPTYSPCDHVTPFPCCRDLPANHPPLQKLAFSRSCQSPVFYSGITCQSLNLPILGKLSLHGFCHLCLWMLSQISGWAFPVFLVGSCVSLAFKCQSSSGLSLALLSLGPNNITPPQRIPALNT